MKIFLGEGMPTGALQDSLVTTPWLECLKHGDFIYIRHQSWRNLSRWVDVDRKRPYIVSLVRKRHVGWVNLSAHTTLELALAAAHKESIRLDKRLNTKERENETARP
jgi:hypothetical protein